MRSVVYGACCCWLGCYSPSVPAGVPCDPASNHCPAGQRCIVEGGGAFCGDPSPGADAGDATPDALPDGSPDSDVDHDGLTDDIDNCRMIANPGQDNEDGDAFGDVCDPCPVFVDGASPSDPDGDGVSGACDPHPMTSGDQIKIFESFRNGIPTGWLTFGSVVATGGDVRASAGGNNHATLRIPNAMRAREAIYARFTVEDASGLGLRTAGVVLQHQANSDAAIECHAGIGVPSGGGPGAGGGGQDEHVALFETGGQILIDQVTQTFVIGTPYVVELRRDQSSYACSVAIGNGAPISVNGSSLLGAAAPELGLRVNAAEARFAWVMHVVSP